MINTKFKNLTMALNICPSNKIEYTKTKNGVEGTFTFFYDNKINVLNLKGRDVHDFFARLALVMGDEEIYYHDLRKELYSLNTFDKMVIKGKGECVAISKANRKKYVQSYEDIQSLDIYLKKLHQQVTEMQNDFAPIQDLNDSYLQNF